MCFFLARDKVVMATVGHTDAVIIWIRDLLLLFSHVERIVQQGALRSLHVCDQFEYSPRETHRGQAANWKALTLAERDLFLCRHSTSIVCPCPTQQNQYGRNFASVH